MGRRGKEGDEEEEWREKRWGMRILARERERERREKDSESAHFPPNSRMRSSAFDLVRRRARLKAKGWGSGIGLGFGLVAIERSFVCVWGGGGLEMKQKMRCQGGRIRERIHHALMLLRE